MMNQMWSVSALVSYIKRGIDHDENLRQLLVRGEISNLVKHRSGHYYFTLKDDKARMSCVMFSNYARLIHFDLENGSKVIAQCKVSVYEASGSVQLYVNGLQPDGIGEMYLQLEALKKKMMSEGYFDPAHKKQLPLYPMDIALISAREAAAASDVRTTIARRWPLAKITFYPSLVQGSEASPMLIETIKKADQNHHDVILLVRGGGSIEDLWAFNQEELARCIYDTLTPIVTGVGHETDTTLVDYVSDARAATPTAAAELVTPDIQEVSYQLQRYKKLLADQMKILLDRSSHHLDKVKGHPYIRNPLTYIENSMMSLDLKRNALENHIQTKMYLQNEIDSKRIRFAHIGNMMVQRMETQLQHQYDKLLGQTKQYRIHSENELSKRIQLLDAYSPLKILLRGYSLTRMDGHCLKSINDVEVNEMIVTTLGDGELYSKVLKKEKNHE